jgi:hypothetical protein
MATLWLAVEFPDADAATDTDPVLVARGLVDQMNEARFGSGRPFEDRLTLAETPPALWRKPGTALTVP